MKRPESLQVAVWAEKQVPPSPQPPPRIGVRTAGEVGVLVKASLLHTHLSGTLGPNSQMALVPL